MRTSARAMVVARLATLLAALLLATLSTSACGDPPEKEMSQAQGAIDAARAAGAADYAAEELRAATTALERANAAVAQRDYRLALSHALDSQEQAQAAAREAADRKARARGNAERLLADVTAALANANARMAAAEAARVPKTALAGPTQMIAVAREAVQEAGTALGREDYRAAAAALEGHVIQLRNALVLLNQAMNARPSRPARSRRGGR